LNAREASGFLPNRQRHEISIGKSRAERWDITLIKFFIFPILVLDTAVR
jgi:hypothetical protein